MSNSIARLRTVLSHISSSLHPAASIGKAATANQTASLFTMSVRSYISLLLFGLVLLVSLSLKVPWLTKSTQDRKATITDWVKPGDKSGEFKRQQSVFRSFISKDPNSEFPAEKDRYHLYVSYACPWGMIQPPSLLSFSIC